MWHRSKQLSPLALVFALAGCGLATAETLDLLIVNGVIVDGTGARGTVASVGVINGRIAFVGETGGREARDTINATGLVVAPGFIDVHNHTARAIADAERRLNEGFIRQGVTTIVGGPDGRFAPDRIRELIAAYEANGIGTNVAFYVGHNGIRRAVMGDDAQRVPTPKELEQMKALVREGMELGALGLSTGLMYEPGMFSKTNEVVQLARVVEAYGGIYDSHVRNPVHALLESHREAIEIGERAGIAPKLGHVKAVGLQNAGGMQEVIALVEAARARGVNVVTDQYPYDGAATSTLDEIIVVPEALRSGSGFDLEVALSDAHTRARLEETSENGIDGGFAWLKATGYGSMRITSSQDYRELVGRYLSELAEARGVNDFDLVAELIIGAEHPVGITLGAMRERDVRDLLVQPWNMVASDGAYSDGVTPVGHPRSTGTFPRVLGHYVREEQVLPLAEAVRKITALPANFLGLEQRGQLAEGMPADIAIFDPETIDDRSTWNEPQLYSVGVVHVLVHGTPVLRGGELTGEAPGRFLPRTEEQPTT